MSDTSPPDRGGTNIDNGQDHINPPEQEKDISTPDLSDVNKNNEDSIQQKNTVRRVVATPKEKW
ncbi:unnamed protein product [Callosobruchus maculatus]|uniref:Uncharacterized protein n=1 Tax=Callosobruchus maculatus TaxID=64391 RepID=A0A653CQ27_CALMS|nr:unnamed protein product [Callosobruchus maculatus]